MKTAAAVFLIVLCLLLGFGPLAAPFGYAAQDRDRILTGPDSQHWLGTDALGRDNFARLLHGGRLSVTMAALAPFTACAVAAADRRWPSAACADRHGPAAPARIVGGRRDHERSRPAEATGSAGHTARDQSRLRDGDPVRLARPVGAAFTLQPHRDPGRWLHRRSASDGRTIPGPARSVHA